MASRKGMETRPTARDDRAEGAKVGVTGAERMRHAGNHEVETFSGRYVDVACPKPDTIALEDIAHGLAHTCRFGGQCFRFYSVAEHAVLVAQKLADEGADLMLVMAGLHHDDAEAYLGDICRPTKKLLGQVYAEMTEDMDYVINRALAWPESSDGSLLWHTADFRHELVKAADEWALASEARMLLPSRGAGWQLAELKWSVGVGLPAFGLPPSIAEKRWLDFHAAYALKLRPHPSSTGSLANSEPESAERDSHPTCPTCGGTGPDVLDRVGDYGGDTFEARCGDEWHDDRPSSPPSVAKEV